MARVPVVMAMEMEMAMVMAMEMGDVIEFITTVPSSVIMVLELQIWRGLWGAVREDGGTRTLAQVLQRMKQSNTTGLQCSVGLASKYKNFIPLLRVNCLDLLQFLQHRHHHHHHHHHH